MAKLTDESRAIIHDAIKLIKQGWTRGAYMREDKNGVRYCMRGALGAACLERNISQNSYVWMDVCSVVDETVRAETTYECVVDFNDAQKSKYSVIEILEKAAQRWIDED